MESKDLATCRSVRYTKGWRKGAVKCAECGFWFVPDDQKYPLVDHGDTCDYLTGAEWFAQFKCCPNCLPKEKPGTPFGKRRCLGVKHVGVKCSGARGKIGWTRARGCGVWLTVGLASATQRARSMGSRNQLCERCNPYADIKKQSRGRAIELGRRLGKRLGRAPTRRDFARAGAAFSPSGIADLFGSWQNFRSVLGFSKSWNPARRYTDEELLGALQATYAEFGRVLSRREYDKLDRSPSVRTLEDRLGGWNNAWLKAGFTPNKCCVDWTPEERRPYWEMAQRARGMHPDQLGPTSRESWLYSQGLPCEESTKRYFEQKGKEEEATRHFSEELAENARKFKEHQFKRKGVQCYS